MGQKVNPIGFRLGYNKTWQSNFYSKFDYINYFQEDIKIRKFLFKMLSNAGLSKVMIERAANKAKIILLTSRPAQVIGPQGTKIEKIKKELAKLTKAEINLNIQEIKRPERDAQLIARSIADQLERRVPFRKAMKRAIQSALRLGAKGIRVNCAGRLGGAEIARTEWYREGRVPLHTLRADIDYAVAEANTTYGVIGVKVWVYNGDVVSSESKDLETSPMK